MNLYAQKNQYKLIRKRHQITIHQNALARDFKEAFSNIPDSAKLMEEDTDKYQNTVLIFEEETKEEM
jgi:hypothetical protein